MSRPKKWKTITTKTLFTHKHITVQNDEVELPNGQITEYAYTPSSSDSVIIVAVNKKGEILIQQEYSHPPNKILWQLPGGSMHEAEGVIEAALRELAEESGYAARTSKKIGEFYVNNRLSNKIQHVVLCQDLYPNKQQEDFDEFIMTTWKTQAKIRDMIADGKFVNINLLAALNIFFHFKKH